MNNFSNKSPNEKVTLTFDFSLEVGDGATIATVVSVTNELMKGTDPTPNAMLIGSPAKSSDSLSVLQTVSGGVDGCNYRFRALVDTDAGERLELAGMLRVRSST